MRNESQSTDARVVSDVGPFAIVPEWLLVDRPVSDRAVRLYALLALMADRTSHAAFPARKTLAQRLSCSVDSVDAAIRELALAGAITKQERFREGRRERSSNLYVVHLTPGGVAAPVRPPSRVGTATGGRTGAAPRTRTSVNQKEEEGARDLVTALDPDLADKLNAEQLSAVAQALAANQQGVIRIYRRARLKGHDAKALFLHMLAAGDHLASNDRSASAFSEYDEQAVA